jgi:hypothetical protein
VAKLMGDAVLAFFGAPVAHEDDPQRAVLAALDMIAAIGLFREEIKKELGIDFNVRVGINTGPVVVGEVGSARAMEYTAMGDAVNVAARMEQTAAPGTVQVSQDTYRLIEPYFECEPLGGIELKGKSEPRPGSARAACSPNFTSTGSIRTYAGRWDTLTGIPYDASRPYGLFQNFARAIFGVNLDDPPPEIHRKIQAYLRGNGAPESQVVSCAASPSSG